MCVSFFQVTHVDQLTIISTGHNFTPIFWSWILSFSDNFTQTPLFWKLIILYYEGLRSFMKCSHFPLSLEDFNDHENTHHCSQWTRVSVWMKGSLGLHHLPEPSLLDRDSWCNGGSFRNGRFEKTPQWSRWTSPGSSNLFCYFSTPASCKDPRESQGPGGCAQNRPTHVCKPT